MWNVPSAERLAHIPRLYETEDTPLKDKLIHVHLFMAGSDWYISEYDGEDLFFGFVVLNADYANSEWGYISLSELQAINIDGIEIDCELEQFWQVRPAGQVPNIKV